ncbi:MAG: hypothetical protein KC519_13075, partial [Anaerolineae bacterium]|nr:hypothetical protein [Anaerolineae bacterium]
MRHRAALLLLGVGLLCVFLGMAANIAVAQEETATPAPEVTETPESQTPEEEPASDAYCLLCHTKPDQVWHLPGGETLSVTIDPEVLAQSVHGESSPEGALACAD